MVNSVAALQLAALKSVHCAWPELCAEFVRLASMVSGVEGNDVCEELGAKICVDLFSAANLAVGGEAICRQIM